MVTRMKILNVCVSNIQTYDM